MAVKSPIPNTNVAYTDIRDTLNAGGGSVTDVVATAFKTTAKINKWSFHKPIEEPNVLFDLTDAQIKARHCGLVMRELRLLRSNCNGFYGTKTNYSKNDILAQVTECTYTLPTTYLRLGDFRGYYNGAVASDKDWENYSFDISELTAFSDSDAMTSTTDGANFTINKTFKQMTKFAINLGGNYNYIGNANDAMLPLPYVAGDGMISGEGWRIAYAVQIPYTTSGTASNEWYLFIGRKTLNTADGVTTMRNYCPPDMSSNTLAVATMIYNVQSKGVKSFTMIPCLVKNAGLTFHALSQTAYRSQVLVNADTIIYAMPSGTKSCLLNITTGGNIPVIGNVAGVKKYGTQSDAWVLGYVYNGSSQGDYGTPINALVVVRSTPITTKYTVTLKMKYTSKPADTDVTTNIPSSGTGSATYTINSGATFVRGGITYYGIVITAAAGLYFTESDVTTFTVG